MVLSLMLAFILAVGAVALGALVATLLGPLRGSMRDIRGAIEHLSATVEAAGSSFPEEAHRRLLELEDEVDRLPSKWDAIRSEANSYYKRAHHHVRRVREEVDNLGFRDTELDALDVDLQRLRGVDAKRGDGEGVHPVPEGVESPQLAAQAATRSPVTVEDMIALKWRG